MKKPILFISLFLLSLIGWSQQCSKITYSYDTNGNRIKTLLVVTPCNEEASMKKINQTAKDSVKPIQSFNVNAYPNPAMDKVTVEIEQTKDGEQSAVFIYDLQGKQVYSNTTSSAIMNIDVSALSPGNYNLQVVKGTKKVSYTIAKN